MYHFLPKFALLLALIFLQQQAQAQCAGGNPIVAGTLTANGTPFVIGPDDSTRVLNFSNPAPVAPFVTEFLISSRFETANDSLGPAIVGVSSSGRILPSDYNLNYCDEFYITPFSYDLHQMRTVLQSFLNDSVPGFGSCCQVSALLAGDICGALSAAGVRDSNDINSIADVLPLFTTLGGGNLSVEGLMESIDFLNTLAPNFSGCTGGVTEICYAIEPLGYDYYRLLDTGGVYFTQVSVQPDSQTISQAGLLNFSAQTTPTTAANDQLIWVLDPAAIAQRITVDNNGQVDVPAGVSNGLYWLIARGNQGCVADTAYFRVDFPVGLFSNPSELALETRLVLLGNGQTALDYQYNQEEVLQIRLFNIQGQLLYQNQLPYQGWGWQRWTAPDLGLAKGMYFIQIQGSLGQISLAYPQP